MTMKELQEAKLEILVQDGNMRIDVSGNSKAIAIILGLAISKIAKEKTKALLSDIALAALVYSEKNVK